MNNNYLDFVQNLATQKDMALSKLKPKNFKLKDNLLIQGTGESESSSRIGLDLKDELSLRVNLQSEDDALYVGTVFIGAPHSMQARVIFDTGSEQLAVTGALCNNHTAGNFRFSQDRFSKSITLEQVEQHEEHQIKQDLKESQEESADNDVDFLQIREKKDKIYDKDGHSLSVDLDKKKKAWDAPVK